MKMANYVKAIEFDSPLHQKQVIFSSLAKCLPAISTGSVTRDAQY